VLTSHSDLLAILSFPTRRSSDLAAHGVTCKKYFCRIWCVFFRGDVEYFKCIQPSPIFPVEAARSTVGGRDQRTPFLGVIRPRLADGFYTSAVNRQKQC